MDPLCASTQANTGVLHELPGNVEAIPVQVFDVGRRKINSLQVKAKEWEEAQEWVMEGNKKICNRFFFLMDWSEQSMVWYMKEKCDMTL